MSRRWTGLAAVVLLAALAGCGSGTPNAGPTTATGTCLPTASASGLSGELPDLMLECFDGSGTVHIRRITGPAVVNLWASWCPPCLTELPVFQRFAEYNPRVGVVGVDTADNRGRAQSVIDDLGLTFPMLYDDRKQLLTGVSRTALPATLFIASDGRLAYVHNAEALDEAALTRLARKHLGAVVP